MDDGSTKRQARLFSALVAGSQLLGVLSVALVAVWMGVYRSGYGWRGELLFSYHPLFMVLGLIFIYGDAILIYRVFRNEKKSSLRIFHAVMQFGALLLAAVALTAVLVTHVNEEKNFYSLHSWMGIAAIGLFMLQFMSGLVAYLSSLLGYTAQARYTPHHRFWGLVIYSLAVATALVGIVENTMFSIREVYADLPAEALIINCLGVTLVINGVIVLYIVSRDEYRKRLPFALDEPSETDAINQ